RHAYPHGLTGGDARAAQLEIRVRERRVAQPMAEREERARRKVDVLRRVLLLGRWPSRVLVIVVNGHLAHAPWKGDGKLAARTHVAEQDIRQRMPGLHA